MPWTCRESGTLRVPILSSLLCILLLLECVCGRGRLRGPVTSHTGKAVASEVEQPPALVTTSAYLWHHFL